MSDTETIRQFWCWVVFPLMVGIPPLMLLMLGQKKFGRTPRSQKKSASKYHGTQMKFKASVMKSFAKLGAPKYFAKKNLRPFPSEKVLFFLGTGLEKNPSCAALQGSVDGEDFCIDFLLYTPSRHMWEEKSRIWETKVVNSRYSFPLRMSPAVVML